MKDTQEKKFRNFTFTMNNYPDTQLVDNINCRYIAYGKEVGEQGTPHLQGFICFHNATSKKSVIKQMPGCHIMSMNGSIRQNEEYCSKEGQLIERGDKPASNDDKGRAQQLRWQRTRELAKSGLLDEVDADIFVQHYSTLKRIGMDYSKKPSHLQEACGIWIHGPTGTGKSHAVWEKYPDAYIKPLSKQWNCYQGEEVAYMDEVNDTHTQWIAPFLLKWADKFVFHADVKYGGGTIRPKRFIITSNYTIDEMNFPYNVKDAIKRRFKEIYKGSREQEIDWS